jgi:hypothetical protein
VNGWMKRPGRLIEPIGYIHKKSAEGQGAMEVSLI